MKIVVDNSLDIAEVRGWLIAHKEETGQSWTDIGRLTDIAGPTLSLFAADKYQGRNDGVAQKIAGYRLRLDAQAQLAPDMPMTPEWYDTATSARLSGLFRLAQRGKFIVVVSTPGVGKTYAARRFVGQDPNAWLATMSPSTAGVATMAAEVASEIGLGEISGSPMQMTRKIRGHLKGKAGVLIVDEAQELTEKAINEIRGWHDRVGVGVVLMGNDKVIGTLDSKKSALAQVSSRVLMRVSQATAEEADIAAALDAWGVQDPSQRTFLSRIARLPGALREMTHTLEIALMAAFGEEATLTLDHLRGAAKQRNVRIGGGL